MMICAGAWAETYIWTGATNNNWAVAGNWTDGTGATVTSYPNNNDDFVYIRSAATISIGSSDIDVDGISLFDNGESNSFSVTISGTGTLRVRGSTSFPDNIADVGIVTYRPTAAQNNESGWDKTTTLVLDCNVEANNLAIHSGGSVTISSYKTARITNVVNMAGSGNVSTAITVNGTLISETISLSDQNNQTLTIDSGATVSTTTITGSNGSVTNNGQIAVSNTTGSNLDTINTNGSGTIALAGENTCTWKGNAATPDWNTAANWQGGIPGSTTAKIIIPATANLPEIKSGDSVTVDLTKLEVASGASIKASGTLIIDSAYTLDSKINTASSGKLQVNGALTNSSAYTFNNLAFECTSLDISANLTCKSMEVSGTTSLTNASGETHLFATGDDGISFGGDVTVYSSGTQFVLGGNVKAASAVNLNIASGMLNHVEETTNNHKDWSTNITAILQNDGSTFGMQNGQSYKTKITATSGGVYLAGSGTISLLDDSSSNAACKLHFGNTEASQENTFTLGTDITLSKITDVVLDASCKGLKGAVTFSGIKNFTNSSAKLSASADKIVPDISLVNGAKISGNNVNLGTVTCAGAVTIQPAAGNSFSFDSLTCNGDATIDGNNTFINLICKAKAEINGDNTITDFTAGTSTSGLGGKTLTINGDQTISGDVSLYGSSSSSKLTIEGSGSLSLTNTLFAKYLDFTGTTPTVSSGTAYASNSSYLPAGEPTGWIVSENNLHIWNGTTTAWGTASNWLPNTSYPNDTEDEVIINTASRYPEITSGITIKKITINAGTVKLDGASASLTIAQGCNLDTNIQGSGKLILPPGQTFSIAGTGKKTFDINIENNGTFSYADPVVFSKSLKNTGTASFTNGASIGGDFEDTGSFTGPITFNGTDAQSFSPKNVIYPNITVNKASGTLSIISTDNDLQVTNLTLTDGAVEIAGDLTLWDGTYYQDFDFTSLADTFTFTGGSAASPRVLKAGNITNSSKISAGYLKFFAQSGKDITLNSCANISNLTLETTGNIQINGITAETLSVVSGAATVKMKGTTNITSTSQDFIIDYPLLLSDDTTFSITKDLIVQGTNGSIKSDTSAGKNLTLTANTIKLLDGNALGDTGTGALGTILINNNLTLGANTQLYAAHTKFAGTETRTFTGAYTLSVTGNVTDTGAWTWPTDSSLKFNGSTDQTLKTTTNSTYKDITVNKTSGNFIIDTSVINTGTLTVTDCTATQFTGLNQISASGNLSFTKPVTANNNLTISTSTTGGNVSFGSTFSSTADLSVTANALSFGNTVNVKNFTINATTTTSSDITVTGKWANNKTSGGFIANGGTVKLTTDSSDTSRVTLSGANTFYNLNLDRNVSVLNSNTISNDLIMHRTDGDDPDKGKIYFAANTRQTITGKFDFKGLSTERLLATCGNATGTTNGTWEIECGSAEVQNVNLKNCKNLSATIVVEDPDGTDANGKSVDAGNNTNFYFLNHSYTWEGGSPDHLNDWNWAANWSPASIPGKGTIIAIPTGKTYYPILTAELDLKYNDSYKGSISIGTTTAPGGQLDLGGQNVTAGEIVNNGRVRLTGAAGQTITLTRTNNTNSVVEYYEPSPSATITNFAWGQNYEKLEINESAEIHTQLTVANTTTITAASSKSITLDSTANTFTGNVILGTALSPTGSVTLVANGSITLSENAYAASINLTTATINIQNVTTSGTQDYNGNTVISSAAAIGSTGNNITFAAGKQLSVNAQTTITVPANKSINFNSTTTGSAKLTTAGDGTAKFTGNVSNLSALETQAVDFNCETLSTTGAQTYNGAATISRTGGSTISSSGGAITFTSGSSITGSTNKLKVETGTGASNSISFAGTVGASGSPFVELEIGTARTTSFAKPVYIATFKDVGTSGNISFNDGGTISNDVSFNTTGAVNFTGTTQTAGLSHNIAGSTTTVTGTLNASSVTLKDFVITGTANINTSGNQIYNGKVYGGGNLVLNSTSGGGSGTIAFNDEVNAAAPASVLSSLQTTGPVTINTSKIKTSTTQIYNSALYLGSAASVLLEGSAVTFNNPVSDTDAATSLEVNAPLTINSDSSPASITTSGNQQYDSTVSLRTATVLTAQAGTPAANQTVTFKGNVTGTTAAGTTLTINANTSIAAATLSITTNGDQTYNGTVTGTGKLTTAGTGTAVFNGNVTLGDLDTQAAKIGTGFITTASGTQVYHGAVELAENTTLTAGTLVSFNATVSGPKSLTVSAPLNINCAQITTSGAAQFYNGTVTLLENTTLSGSSVTFNENVNGSKTLTVSAPLTVNCAQITTTGTTQTYNGNITITAANPTFTATEVDFSGDIAVSAPSNALTLNTPIVKSIITSGTANITLNTLTLSRDNTILTSANASNISMTANKIDGIGKQLTLSNNIQTITFSNGMEIVPVLKIEKVLAIVFAGSATLDDNVLIGTAGDGSDIDKSFYSSGAGIITIKKDLIIDALGGKKVALNCALNSAATSSAGTIRANNVVLYSGDVYLYGNLSSKIDGATSGENIWGDIIILGNTNYSTADSGVAKTYYYNQTRLSSPSFNPSGAEAFTEPFRSGPYEAVLNTMGSATITVGKNFYTNGTTLQSASSDDWSIELPDISDAVNGFAEAIQTTVSNCKVSCWADSSNTATDDTAPAKVVAYECTVDTTNTNWNSEAFSILEAYTVRDNAILVKFNAPVRNRRNEINNADGSSGTIQYLQYQNATGSTASFEGIYSDPDCQTRIINSNITTNEAGGYKLYIKAPSSWNTDATGKSEGTSKSSDRYGNNKSALPYLDIPRSLAGSGSANPITYIITNKWGKRLDNYSPRTNSGIAYGSTADTTHDVEDKTGPVLWTVRTGQELHEAYDTAVGETSQHSYDSHNFLEFRYSEPVDIDTLTAASVPVENIQVTDSLGAITGNITSPSSEITFAGLARITGTSLLLHTGSNGSANKYVNALYRQDEYSIRLSIAGWTDGTVSDYAGNIYKKWPGYIEAASQFTGARAHIVDSSNTVFTLVKDQANNSQTQYDENMVNPEILDNSSDSNPSDLLLSTAISPDCYSKWDISSPVFAPLRFSSRTDWEDQDMSEAIGNTNGSGSTLDRIDFHFFDNTPNYNSEDTAEWFTEIGWCNRDSDASKANLYDSSYTYTADIIGGARQFDSTAARRTTGGIRLSTKTEIASAFKYAVSYNATPSSSFLTGVENLHTTVVSQLFTGSSAPMRAANDPDGLYFGLALSDSNLSFDTTFTVSYNESLGYLTDLAGNRLRNKTTKTIDRTPPSFDVILSPVDTKSIYILFAKKIVTNKDEIKFLENAGPDHPISINESSFETLMPLCFRIISINSDGSITESTENQIDTSVPAEIIEEFSSESFTCIKLTTTKEINIDNLKSLYIQLIMPSPYPTATLDPITNTINSRVTFIQDIIGNYMSMYSAHALSDFAINYVKPLYAYSSDMLDDGVSVMNGLYEEGSWAVHDWNAGQQNYGTLPANHPAAIVADTKANDKVRIYLSNSPDDGSVSEQFNEDFGLKLRIWLPDLTDGLFRALSTSNNENFVALDGSSMEESADNLIFNIPTETISAWPSGSQVSFMYGIMEDEENPVRIYNNPYYDLANDRFNLSLSIPVPLYCLRMQDVTDISTLDLWSFKLKGITSQRGGVTILNNVINASKSEKTVIKIDLPADGRLSVMVMTLDGNIITYLNRGETKAGEHFFTWDGKNKNGKPVARGMYFVRVTGSGIDETRKVMVVKN